MKTNKTPPKPVLDFTEISTCNSVELLVEFREHLNGIILGMKAPESVLAVELKKEVQKVNNRLQELK